MGSFLLLADSWVGCTLRSLLPSSRRICNRRIPLSPSPQVRGSR